MFLEMPNVKRQKTGLDYHGRKESQRPKVWNIVQCFCVDIAIKGKQTAAQVPVDETMHPC